MPDEILGIPYDDDVGGPMPDGLAHPTGFTEQHAVKYAGKLQSAEDARMVYEAEKCGQNRQAVLNELRPLAEQSHLWSEY